MEHIQFCSSVTFYEQCGQIAPFENSLLLKTAEVLKITTKLQIFHLSDERTFFTAVKREIIDGKMAFPGMVTFSKTFGYQTTSGSHIKDALIS